MQGRRPRTAEQPRLLSIKPDGSVRARSAGRSHPVHLVDTCTRETTRWKTPRPRTPTWGALFFFHRRIHWNPRSSAGKHLTGLPQLCFTCASSSASYTPSTTPRAERERFNRKKKGRTQRQSASQDSNCGILTITEPFRLVSFRSLNSDCQTAQTGRSRQQLTSMLRHTAVNSASRTRERSRRRCLSTGCCLQDARE